LRCYVGLGRVGRHVAAIGNAFGMRVVGWSPRLTDASAAAAGAERRELDDLLREADVVTIHAYLVNTARGPIVDEAALVAALTEQRIAGAGLDVFDREPLPAGHPFTRLGNVVLTPHIGWPTDEGYQRFAEAACDVLLAYLNGADVPRFTG